MALSALYQTTQWLCGKTTDLINGVLFVSQPYSTSTDSSNNAVILSSKNSFMYTSTNTPDSCSTFSMIQPEKDDTNMIRGIVQNILYRDINNVSDLSSVSSVSNLSNLSNASSVSNLSNVLDSTTISDNSSTGIAVSLSKNNIPVETNSHQFSKKIRKNGYLYYWNKPEYSFNTQNKAYPLIKPEAPLQIVQLINMMASYTLGMTNQVKTPSELTVKLPSISEYLAQITTMTNTEVTSVFESIQEMDRNELLNFLSQYGPDLLGPDLLGPDQIFSKNQKVVHFSFHPLEQSGKSWLWYIFYIAKNSSDTFKTQIYYYTLKLSS